MPDMRLLTPAPPSAAAARLWSIILAGGEGSRLRPLVERIHTDGRPKQFAVLTGSKSLLGQTLDRTALAVPAARTVVVATRAHAKFFPRELAGPGAPSLIVQPRDRGTAAGILLPAHWISWRDPDAIVAVFPCDHFIGDDAAFMAQVARMRDAVARHPTRILLLGATPDSAETGYGWIEPGMELEKSPAGVLLTVLRFREKPSPEAARACMQRGGLWNTFVMVARVSTFVEAGRAALPGLYERLERVRPFTASPAEAAAIERAYALCPDANFSTSVLSAAPERLAVSPLPPMAWSDWGTPERVIQTLRGEGIVPDWLRELATTA